MTGVWLRDLADILRQANVPVVEMKYERGPFAGRKWTQVGANNRGLAGFDYIMWHHDASPAGPSGGAKVDAKGIGTSPTGALGWCMYSDVAPAASIWIDMQGTWFLYVAGLAWHAGRGGPGWGVAANMMNYYALGIETDHTTGEPWPAKQIDSLRRGTAAIMAAYEMDPRPGLLFHKTWTDGGIDGVPTLPTRGRKNDPDGLDLAAERRRVADIIAEMGRNEKRLARLARQRRNWRARRNAIRAAGKTAGIATARKKIKELSQRIKALRG
jgi:hypothetical protein